MAIYAPNVIAGIVVALASENPALLLAMTIAIPFMCWATLAYLWQHVTRTGTAPVARFAYLLAVGPIGLDVLITVASYRLPLSPIVIQAIYLS